MITPRVIIIAISNSNDNNKRIMAGEWRCVSLKRHGGSIGTIITTVNRIAVFSWSHVLV